MSELMGDVIPLSLGAMVSPTVLGAVVLVLSGKVAPRARAWVFTAGCAVVLVGFTLAAPLIAQGLTSINPLALSSLDLLFAFLLLVLAGRKLLMRKTAAASAKKRAPKRLSATTPHLPEYFGFGAVMLATDFSSTVLYLAILKEVGVSHEPDWVRLAAVAMGFMAVMLPALLPTVLGTIAPKMCDRLLGPLSAWMSDHATSITVAICLVFAALLLFKGLKPLMG